MAPLINDLSNLLAMTCGAGVVILVAITIVAVLVRQLNWYGIFDGMRDKDA